MSTGRARLSRARRVPWPTVRPPYVEADRPAMDGWSSGAGSWVGPRTPADHPRLQPTARARRCTRAPPIRLSTLRHCCARTPESLATATRPLTRDVRTRKIRCTHGTPTGVRRRAGDRLRPRGSLGPKIAGGAGESPIAGVSSALVRFRVAGFFEHAHLPGFHTASRSPRPDVDPALHARGPAFHGLFPHASPPLRRRRVTGRWSLPSPARPVSRPSPVSLRHDRPRRLACPRRPPMLPYARVSA